MSPSTPLDPAAIRAAAPQDLDAVHALYMHPRVVPFLGVDPMPLEPFRDVFRALCERGEFLVLELDGRVAGFCRNVRLAGRAAHVAQIGTFALEPALHGRGLAQAFLEAVIARLQARGVLRIELQAEADNARALAFYRRLGFEVEGVQRAAYRRAGEPHFIDEVMLARLLAPLPRQATTTE